KLYNAQIAKQLPTLAPLAERITTSKKLALDDRKRTAIESKGGDEKKKKEQQVDNGKDDDTNDTDDWWFDRPFYESKETNETLLAELDRCLHCRNSNYDTNTGFMFER